MARFFLLVDVGAPPTAELTRAESSSALSGSHSTYTCLETRTFKPTSVSSKKMYKLEKFYPKKRVRWACGRGRVLTRTVSLAGGGVLPRTTFPLMAMRLRGASGLVETSSQSTYKSTSVSRTANITLCQSELKSCNGKNA